VVDLEEECFDAVMYQFFRVRVALLEATTMKENSAYWRDDVETATGRFFCTA